MGSARASLLALSSVRRSSCAFFLWNWRAEIAARSAMASVESSLEKGSGEGSGMYSAGAIALVVAKGCCTLGSGGRNLAAPCWVGAGRTGSTLGVMGLYSGATGMSVAGANGLKGMDAGGGAEKVKVLAGGELVFCWEGEDELELRSGGGFGGLSFSVGMCVCARYDRLILDHHLSQFLY